MHAAFDARPDRKIQEVVDGCQDNPSTPLPPFSCLRSKFCTPWTSLPPSLPGSHLLFMSVSLTNYTVASQPPSEAKWRLQNVINIIISQRTPSQSCNRIMKPLHSLASTRSKDTEWNMQIISPITVIIDICRDHINTVTLQMFPACTSKIIPSPCQIQVQAQKEGQGCI